MTEGLKDFPELRQAFEAAPQPYLLLEPNLTIAGANAAFCRATSHAPETLVGRNIFDALRDRPGVELEGDERYLRLLFGGIRDCAIYMLDPEGKIVSWNPGAERIKGYTATEIVGTHYSVFFGEEDRAAGTPQKALEAARVAGKYESEGWRYRKDGSRFWASVLVDTIRDEHGTLLGFAKLTRDTTQQMETRAALERTRQQLAQSQKMDAIGQLTGGVAHDFNNLLTVILSNADLLASKLADRPEQRRLAEITRLAAERGAQLTNSLLAFARRQPLEPVSVNVNKILSVMDPLFRRTLRENIEMEFVQGAGLWTAVVDVAQLESAVLNLVLNARDAMPDGGRLTVETGNASIDSDYSAQYDDVSPGQYVLITVTDTGTGMSPETVARAFDPFFSTKMRGKGTGLGLSMTYGFVKQSGGHIKIYSEEGHGTSVKIYLPRSRENEAPHDAPARDDADEPRGNEAILMVEDDDLVRDHVAGLLQTLGYYVLAARSGIEAMAIIERGDHVDLVFTDVVMPGGMSGRDLANEIAAQRPSLPVLFTSGYTENAIVHQGRLDSGVHLLRKPYRRRDLARKLRQVLDLPKRS